MNEKLKRLDINKFSGKNSALIAVILLIILSIILKGSTFLSYSNVINILLNNSIIGIISLGMTLIIITGEIDLSVGAQLALTGLISISVANNTGNVFLGVILCCLLSVILGICTGGLVSKFGIPSFIVTLGTMSIFRSVAEYMYNGGGLTVKGDALSPYIAISNTNLFGVLPLPILYWIVLSIIIYLFTSKTATGRHIYAVGSNEKASLLSSIKVSRVKIVAFGVSGLMVALAAIIESARLGSMDSATSGSSYEMDAIAAVVIGGTSMSGGHGSIMGTFFGTLIIGIINNMMNLLGVPPFLQGAVKGAIIIGAVLFQKRLDRKSV